MFDLALHHLTHDERQRTAEAKLHQRQVLKTAEVKPAPIARPTAEARPASAPAHQRIGVNPRPAER